jgi:ferredoxin-type protein NapG
MNDQSTHQGKPGKRSVNRRKFLTDMAKTACGVSLFALAVGLNAKQSAASLPAEAIRPPGALPEDEFLNACTRCGMCVQDCPYGILKLAELGESVATGTPYFTARTGPCEMCEDIPCIPACPTNALDHSLTDIDQSRMGLAVLIDQETCIAFRGLRCEVCFNVCPLQGKAIKLETRANKRTGMHAIFPPVVFSEHCTGCGLCEKVCILEESAIKVLPIRLAKGELGHHYRLGWESKGNLGSKFPTADPEHHYRLPEGLSYEHSGRGLYETHGARPAVTVPGTQMKQTPFSSNPLDTLNQGLKGAK